MPLSPAWDGAVPSGQVSRWALLLLLVGCAVFIRLKGTTDFTLKEYPEYLVFSLIFVLFLSSMQFKRQASPKLDRLDRTGRFFANFSFTLYVLHVPMIVVMGYVLRSVFGIAQLSPHSMLHFLIYAGMYLMLVLGAYLFYLPFESNTPRVRQWLKAQLFARGGTVRL